MRRSGNAGDRTPARSVVVPVLASGRQFGQDTMPGSTISSPSKKATVTSGSRKMYGIAPLALYSSWTARWASSDAVEWLRER